MPGGHYSCLTAGRPLCRPFLFYHMSHGAGAWPSTISPSSADSTGLQWEGQSREGRRCSMEDRAMCWGGPLPWAGCKGQTYQMPTLQSLSSLAEVAHALLVPQHLFSWWGAMYSRQNTSVTWWGGQHHVCLLSCSDPSWRGNLQHRLLWAICW